MILFRNPDRDYLEKKRLFEINQIFFIHYLEGLVDLMMALSLL